MVSFCFFLYLCFSFLICKLLKTNSYSIVFRVFFYFFLCLSLLRIDRRSEDQRGEELKRRKKLQFYFANNFGIYFVEFFIQRCLARWQFDWNVCLAFLPIELFLESFWAPQFFFSLFLLFSFNSLSNWQYIFRCRMESDGACEWWKASSKRLTPTPKMVMQFCKRSRLLLCFLRVVMRFAFKTAKKRKISVRSAFCVCGRFAYRDRKSGGEIQIERCKWRHCIKSLFSH